MFDKDSGCQEKKFSFRESAQSLLAQQAWEERASGPTCGLLGSCQVLLLENQLRVSHQRPLFPCFSVC